MCSTSSRYDRIQCDLIDIQRDLWGKRTGNTYQWWRHLRRHWTVCWGEVLKPACEHFACFGEHCKICMCCIKRVLQTSAGRESAGGWPRSFMPWSLLQDNQSRIKIFKFTLYLKACLLQVGTFTSSGDSESNFVLTNGTFVGDGLCSGEGVFGTDDSSSNLTIVDGEGSVAGTGIFHFP